jgi:hypothetical protein
MQISIWGSGGGKVGSYHCVGQPWLQELSTCRKPREQEISLAAHLCNQAVTSAELLMVSMVVDVEI